MHKVQVHSRSPLVASVQGRGTCILGDVLWPKSEVPVLLRFLLSSARQKLTEREVVRNRVMNGCWASLKSDYRQQLLEFRLEGYEACT